MSLHIITDRDELAKSGVKYIECNDIYFNSVQLKDNEITRCILQYIDKAQYSSPYTFISRDSTLGDLNKSLLSTGCKTILNILYNPNICFDIAECGQNALEALSLLDSGIVYWDKPTLFLLHDTDCNILYNGKQYSKYKSFLDEVM